jgi:hypothetical protein
MSDEDRSVLQPIVGSAAYATSYAGLGAAAIKPMMSLMERANSGVPITAGAGTPLASIAEFSREEVKAIQAFAEQRGVKVPIISSLMPNASYYYQAGNLTDKVKDGAKKIMGQSIVRPASHIGLASTDLPTAFHEVGHAGGNRTLRKTMFNLSTIAGGTPGHLLRLGLLGHAITEPEEDASKTRKFLHENAPALVAASHAPQLAEELRASSSAVRGARRHGVGALKSLKVLLPAFGTYAGNAGASVAAMMIAQKIVHALRDRAAAREEDQEKTSAAKQGVEVKSSGALRTPASAAWRIGGRTPPKPKSIKPNTHELGAPAKTRMAAKPPSNKDYFKDTLQSLYNPGRGYRLGVVG